jgi:hypothetical protein
VAAVAAVKQIEADIALAKRGGADGADQPRLRGHHLADLRGASAAPW